MTLAIIIVVFSFVALFFVLRIAVGRGLQTLPGPREAEQIRPIDVEAFRNLVDHGEDEYLHRRLPPAEFRTVQRARLRAAAAYVQEAGRNAAVLVKIGQGALASSDGRTAEAAAQLVNDALLLRRNAAFALLRIYTAMAWPDARMAAVPFLDSYQQLSASAMLLGRLQNPAAPVRLSAR
jgi:hypothetical protein